MRLQEITQLLTESRLDYLIKNYSSQVGAQLSEDYTFREISGSYKTKSQKYDQSAIYWIANLMNKDPSHNGMYTQWMIIQYIKGNFINEDKGNILDDLTYFHVNKRLFAEKDINKYTVDQLYTVKKQIEDKVDSVQSKRQEKVEIKQGAEKVLETENVLVIHPQTMEAAQYYGSNTRWCTSARNNNMFDYYNNEGPLYIVIDKKTNQKYQIHFHTDELRNAIDEEVNVDKFIQKYPEVINHFKEEYIKISPLLLLSNKELDKYVEKEKTVILDNKQVSLFIPNTELVKKYYGRYYDTEWYNDHTSVNVDVNIDYMLIDKTENIMYTIIFNYSYYHGILSSDDGSEIDSDELKARYPEIFNILIDELILMWGFDLLSEEEIEYKAQKETKTIIKNKSYTLLEPTTPLSTWYHSQDTLWALAYQGNHYTDIKQPYENKFHKHFPIYILLNHEDRPTRGTGRKYLISKRLNIVQDFLDRYDDYTYSSINEFLEDNPQYSQLRKILLKK